MCVGCAAYTIDSSSRWNGETVYFVWEELMELKQLTDETLKLFDVPDTSNLSEKMLETELNKLKDEK